MEALPCAVMDVPAFWRSFRQGHFMDQASAQKLWVENWQRVGPILEKIRHEELRAMTEKDSARTHESLSEFALDLPNRKPRTTSGFVEQQRLLLKLAKHVSAG